MQSNPHAAFGKRVNLMRALPYTLSKLLGAQSRATQREFVGVMLFLLFVGTPMIFADHLIGWHRYIPVGNILGTVFLTFFFIPYLVIVARRLHDIGVSGWYCLLGMATVGYIVILQLAVVESSEAMVALTLGVVGLHLPLLTKPGESIENRWGPDPRSGKPVAQTKSLFISTLAKSFDYKTRASRYEYWLFIGMMSFLTIPCVLIDRWQNWYDPELMLGPISGILLGASIFPSLAVSVRRIHDTGCSGWYFLLTFIPMTGPLTMFVFAVVPGIVGPNRFGQDPYAPNSDAETPTERQPDAQPAP